MSKNKKNKNLNNVSSSNIDVNKILDAIKKVIKATEEDEYLDYCNKYFGEDLENYDIEDLKIIYEVGNGLLNQYLVTEKGSCDNQILMQLQYIMNTVMYNIIQKQISRSGKQSSELDAKLETNIQEAKKLKESLQEESKEIKHVKNDLKTIITVIISVVLTISIVPSAIVGIQHISADYILPFLASIILFGIIMITFVYSIYQDKLKSSTWTVLLLATVLCIIFWCIGLNITIDKEHKGEGATERILTTTESATEKTLNTTVNELPE